MIFSITKDMQSSLKGAAAGVVTGGLAFLAVKTLTSNARARRRTAAKAMKLLGSFMDAM